MGKKRKKRSISLLPSLGISVRSTLRGAPKNSGVRAKISITNSSTVLTDAQIEAAVGALQKQVTRDFAPVWGADADLSFVPAGRLPPKGSWSLVVLDDSDQADDLGYHDLTADGLPQGKIFAGSDLKGGYHWTVTASHELVEMLADPDINLNAFVQATGRTGVLLSYEVADACEADEYGYRIDGVLVSDFVYPAWFETFRAARSARFDHVGHIDKPLGILPGGYLSTFDVSSGTGWHQRNAEGQPYTYAMRARLGSRRERRRTPRDQWIRSKPRLPPRGQ
jgi:hypothetical protein